MVAIILPGLRASNEIFPVIGMEVNPFDTMMFDAMVTDGLAAEQTNILSIDDGTANERVFHYTNTVWMKHWVTDGGTN